MRTELEVVQKFTDAPLTECPECQGDLRKVFNAVGVVFKGSGFYATDNRTKQARGRQAEGGRRRVHEDRGEGRGSVVHRDDARPPEPVDSDPIGALVPIVRACNSLV